MMLGQGTLRIGETTVTLQRVSSGLTTAIPGRTDQTFDAEIERPLDVAVLNAFAQLLLDMPAPSAMLSIDGEEIGTVVWCSVEDGTEDARGLVVRLDVRLTAIIRARALVAGIGEDGAVWAASYALEDLAALFALQSRRSE